MSKAFKLHQIRMIQRRNTAPPGQYLVTVEVRFDQPYDRRHPRTIRRGEKSAPAFWPNQLCQWVDPINRSSFIFCPQVHCPSPSGVVNQGEEKQPGKMKQET